jgi:hypothetical protein
MEFTFEYVLSMLQLDDNLAYSNNNEEGSTTKQQQG